MSVPIVGPVGAVGHFTDTKTVPVVPKDVLVSYFRVPKYHDRTKTV